MGSIASRNSQRSLPTCQHQASDLIVVLHSLLRQSLERPAAVLQSLLGRAISLSNNVPKPAAQAMAMTCAKNGSPPRQNKDPNSVAQPAESVLMVRTWLQGLQICCCVSTLLLLLLAQAHASAPPHAQSRSHFGQAITLPWQVLNGLLA